eukprot:Gb_22106 [translate_table: standard]
MKAKSTGESLFLVGFDGDVTDGVGDAGQDVATSNLVVVQEITVGLIDFAGENLTCAGGA